jgi:hypothetical protein
VELIHVHRSPGRRMDTTDAGKRFGRMARTGCALQGIGTRNWRQPLCALHILMCDANGDWHTERKWQLAGSDNPREVSFQWAAERGTVLQRGSSGEDALSYWLDLLRARSPKYESWTATSTTNSEEVDLGRIENVCGASAEYCYKLETAAMESERKANQNGPPPVIEPAMPATDPTETPPSSAGTVEGAISGPVDGRTATADADTNGDLRLSDNGQLVPVPVPPIQRYFRKVGETWSVYFDGKPVTITHKLGMTYICELLRSPGRSLRCLELQTSIR